MAKTCTIIKAGRADAYGRPLLVGQIYTGPDDEVFSLWQAGFATVGGAPGAFIAAPQIRQQVIANSKIPVFIMHGDGAANGCQFTGTSGAFTLSATIGTNVGSVLNGSYAYLSANFGGSSRPAGWYWVEFSNDTTGILYANMYSGIGSITAPATKESFSENLTGWVTATTSEVTIRSDILLPRNAVGLNGSLQWYSSSMGTAIGTKSYRLRDEAAAQIGYYTTSTWPAFAIMQEVLFVGSYTVSRASRPVGLGVGSVAPQARVTTRTTQSDQSLSITLQGSSNVSAPIVDSFSILSVYGE